MDKLENGGTLEHRKSMGVQITTSGYLSDE